MFCQKVSRKFAFWGVLLTVVGGVLYITRTYFEAANELRNS